MFFGQMLQALDELHTQGYAHLDIKPENLLISKDMKLKLADFGTTTKDEQSTFKYGTREYMAPEQFSKKPYDPRYADMFAVGVTLFQMITQNLPFTNSTAWNKVYAKIRENQWDQFWSATKKKISENHADIIPTELF